MLLANYSYAPDNKRVWRGSWNYSTGARTTDEITFWSLNGQKMATYALTTTTTLTAAQTGINYYFGGKLIKNNNGWVYSDRLSSIGKFYPYGMERPSATTNGAEKFTGYFRDAESGNDYADQRYISPGTGRFITSDRLTGHPSDPGSWNKYAYAGGDPINRKDPSGRDYCDPNDPNCVDVTDSLDCDPSGYNCPLFDDGSSTPDPCVNRLANCSDPGGGVPTQVGGGAPGTISLQSLAQTTSALQFESIAAMASLGAGCTKALQDDGLYDDMAYNAANATFYQAFGTTGTLTLGDIGYGAYIPDKTLTDWCTDAIACTAGSAGILVTQLFYGQSTADQYVTLTHELLHYTLAVGSGNANYGAYSDVGTAAFLGLTYTGSASTAITAWLQADCPPTQ
jgi:RHS repeat-associated protein